MPPRLSLKPDASFFRKIAIGAVGARAVSDDLGSYKHNMVELENGSTDTKIWKDVKRKRVRIPDLVCVNCGLRVESRAKTRRGLFMSHSPTDAERSWDFGMVDGDVVAFPICRPALEEDWSTGQLEDDQSYWHKRERVDWETCGWINYFYAGDFRKVPPAGSATKGVTEGTETSISWNAIFSTRKGLVEAVAEGQRISVRRASDGHLYTWRNDKGLPVVVEEGSTVEEQQILACPVAPLGGDALTCPESLSQHHIPDLLHSPERTQRFTGVKLARLRAEPQFGDLIRQIALHPDEDVYVQLEGAAYLNCVCGEPAQKLFAAYLASPDAQIRLETVVALAESATAEAVAMLADLLDEKDSPFFLRSAAAWALGRIGTDKATGRLVQAFADVDQSIRYEALEAISSLGTPALDHLVGGLEHADQDIAAGSAEAIRRLASLPPAILQDIVSLVEDDPGRLWAVWALGHLPREQDYVAATIAQLQDSRPEAHYAISVLWAFAENWISQQWELLPMAGVSINDE